MKNFKQLNSHGRHGLFRCSLISRLLIIFGLFIASTGFGAGLSDLTYSISGNEVTITSCNTSATGVMSIPSTIEGYPVTSIGFEAFYDCGSLTSVIIPDSVTFLGESAFKYCYDLASVTIGNGVTSIARTAFQNCSSLTSVTIGTSVTSIEDKAFGGCTSLASITIPSNVTSIDGSFSACTGLTSVTIGSGVSYIGQNTFQDCSSLTSITIPNSVTVIDEMAFSGCSALASVSIGAGVTAIEGYAFNNCTSLTSILFAGSTAPTLGNNVFSNVSAQAAIIYPVGGSGYGNSFGGIPASPAPANGVFGDLTYSINGNEVEITDCDEQASGSLVIPDEIGGYPVTSIGISAFANCISLTKVTIPSSVTMIGRDAFSLCISLAEVVVLPGEDSPSALISIGDRAFQDCSSLTSVTIPENVTYIGNLAFSDCSSLTSIYFEGYKAPILGGPSVFSGVSAQATIFYPGDDDYNATYSEGYSNPFAGLPAVASSGSLGYLKYSISNYEVTITDCDEQASGPLVIPAMIAGYPVTAIGGRVEAGDFYRGAFNGCYNLTSVTIPESVTTIGEEAFKGCSSLASVNIPAGVTVIAEETFEDCYDLTTVNIPDGVTIIGQEAFHDCNDLTSVTIPDSVTYIAAGAFASSGLTSVTIPDSVTAIAGENGDESGAFGYCEDLTSVVIGNGVRSIGDGAFNECYSLASVVIGNSVRSIGKEAFYDCRYLTSVTIPDSVATIGNSAFASCDRLTRVTIGDGVVAIGDFAFQSCDRLASVTVGSSVISIGDYAFRYGIALKYVIFKGFIAPSLGDNPFSGAFEELLILYPRGANGYGSWDNDYDRTIMEGGVVGYLTYSISDNDEVSILDCDNLAPDVLEIPTTIESYPVAYIGPSAFISCYSLTRVIIPDGVKTIGVDAFNDCSILTRVIIPDSVTSLGDGAFSYCFGLKSVTIGNRVSRLGDGTFYACDSLVRIVIKRSTAPTLGQGVFLDVSAQATVIYPSGASGYGSQYGGLPTMPGGVMGDFIYTISNNAVAIVDCDELATGALEIPSTIEGYSVDRFEESAFADCSALTSVEIPGSVTNIGNLAFQKCSGLTSMTIPGSVTSIGNLAFFKCSNLASIHFEGSTAPALGTTVFLSVSAQAAITYPSGASGYSNPFGGLPASPLVTETPPEISVAYNGTNIVDGDSSPSTGKGTDFGSQGYTSGSVTRTFRVSNSGESTLSLGAASSSSGEFSVSGLTSSISAGSFDDFTVTFDPSSVGTKIATVSFSTNDSDEGPFNFTVIGVGTEPVATTWYSGASQIQPTGWLYYSWFKGFKPEGPNWIYHGRHGWLYTLADDTNKMFLWDGELGRWMFTNATAYPWMYAYGPGGGWVFFFEGGRPGARYFKRGDNGQTVSEQQLRVNP